MACLYFKTLPDNFDVCLLPGISKIKQEVLEDSKHILINEFQNPGFLPACAFNRLVDIYGRIRQVFIFTE